MGSVVQVVEFRRIHTIGQYGYCSAGSGIQKETL